MASGLAPLRSAPAVKRKVPESPVPSLQDAGEAFGVVLTKPSLIEPPMIRFPAARRVRSIGKPLPELLASQFRSSVDCTVRSLLLEISIPGRTSTNKAALEGVRLPAMVAALAEKVWMSLASVAYVRSVPLAPMVVPEYDFTPSTTTVGF